MCIAVEKTISLFSPLRSSTSVSIERVNQRKAVPRKIGLARALSKLGYCSRSQAAELIRAGEVRLNGNVRRDPETPVRLECDRILVKGRPVEAKPEIYLMMNKPRGVVTTASDEKRRETVYDVLEKSRLRNVTKDSALWISPVGRLDKASEGLLLLTNDSEWGARITAPETHLEKTYHVQIATLANDTIVNALIRGVETGVGKDRERLRARQARVLRTGAKNCWLEIVLDEGKNRQIRRMMVELEVDVLRLVRVGIGSLQLGNLAKGACRPLTREEKLSLDRAIGIQAPPAKKSAHD